MPAPPPANREPHAGATAGCTPASLHPPLPLVRVHPHRDTEVPSVALSPGCSACSSTSCRRAELGQNWFVQAQCGTVLSWAVPLPPMAPIHPTPLSRSHICWCHRGCGWRSQEHVARPRPRQRTAAHGARECCCARAILTQSHRALSAVPSQEAAQDRHCSQQQLDLATSWSKVILTTCGPPTPQLQRQAGQPAPPASRC